jgi:hypothetical protein
MTQKIRMLALLLLPLLALAMAGIVGAVAADAATAPASLAWSPTTSSGTYNYGTLAAKATKSVTFTLTNSGGKASGPLTITLSGSSAFISTQDGCSGGSLGPRKSCTDTVEYASTSSGQRTTATLSATGEGSSASLTLTGTTSVGTIPTLTLSPGTFEQINNGANIYSYVFPNTNAGSSVTTTFTVTNCGTCAAYTFTIQCESLCPAPFTLLHDKCTNMNLGSNQSCTFDLEFTASADCTSTPYYTNLKVIGHDNNVTYIILLVNTNCGGS